MAARQDITTKLPALKARVAGLREGLARHVAAPSQARVDLLVIYSENRAVMPAFSIENEHNTPLYRESMRVEARMREQLHAIIDAPTPTTLEGLRTLALAMAIQAEGNLNGFRGDREPEYARAARALLVATGMSPPPGFTGFGDEPDHEARVDALMSAPVRLPAWASAEAARAA